MRRVLWCGLLLAGIAVVGLAAHATAREYWFPAIGTDVGTEQVVLAFNDGPFPSEIVVEGKEGILQKAVIAPGKTLEIELPVAPGARSGIVPAYRIAGSESVQVLGMLRADQVQTIQHPPDEQLVLGGGATRLLADHEWGFDYWILQNTQGEGWGDSPHRGEANPIVHASILAFTAGVRDADVTLVPSIRVPMPGGADLLAGHEYSISIGPFQAWVGRVNPPDWSQLMTADWSGTSVHSVQPLSVFQGLECAGADVIHHFSPYAVVWPKYWTTCNPVIEQVPPGASAGIRFIACAPSLYGTGYDPKVRVLATAGPVTVEVKAKDRVKTFSLARAGDWIDITLFDQPPFEALIAHRINATGPVLALLHGELPWTYAFAQTTEVFYSSERMSVFLEPVENTGRAPSRLSPIPFAFAHASQRFMTSEPVASFLSKDYCRSHEQSTLSLGERAIGHFYWDTPGADYDWMGADLYTIDPRNHCPPKGALAPESPREVRWIGQAHAIAWMRPMDIGDCALMGYRIEASVDRRPYTTVGFVPDTGGASSFEHPLILDLPACHVVNARVIAVTTMDSEPAQAGPRVRGPTCGQDEGSNDDEEGEGDEDDSFVRPVPFARSGVVPDSDGDGIDDFADNCPGTSNHDQSDSDGDGTGEACQTDKGPEEPAGLSPLIDTDGDGIADVADNCPFLSNRDQRDADYDEQGDACDADMDGDRVPNHLDNCPYLPNHQQTDGDGDGVGDVCADPILALPGEKGKRQIHSAASTPRTSDAGPRAGVAALALATMAATGAGFLVFTLRRQGPPPHRP